MNQEDLEAVVERGERRPFRALHELLKEDIAIVTGEVAMQQFWDALKGKEPEPEEIKR
jgi:hypothetical protein